MNSKTINMKQSIIGIKSLLVIVSVIMLSGCSSARKAAGSNKSAVKNEIVFFENNLITDPVSNYTWSYFNDNPTTYFRYKLSSSGNLARLPNMEQMLSLLEKVGHQTAMKKDPGNIISATWFNIDCDFLTSSSLKTNEGEILYEVAHWDATTKTAKKDMVTGGDLVYLLLLKEN
jgi:hypothetical protein